jgi:hypothetical protein
MAPVKHGYARRGRKTKLYHVWQQMWQRCNNPKHHKYPYYGGVGVKVCSRWREFENFVDDVGERPEGMSLDRYPNNNGDYEPNNVRWATPSQQSFNRRPRRVGCKRNRKKVLE